MTKAHEKIRSHTVFIGNRKSKEIGSGALVQVQDKFFVLSAAHVLEGDIDISLGLATPKTQFTILNKWIDTSLDIGYLELKPFEVTILLGEINAPFIVRKRGTLQVPSRVTMFALSGFPSHLAKRTKTHIEIEVMFVTVSHLAFEHWPSAYKETYDPKIHFLLPFGPKQRGRFFDREGKESEFMDPHGLSGSGLWFFDPKTENDEEPKYSLTGILRSFDSFYQVLVGSQISPLLDKILDQYKLNLGMEGAYRPKGLPQNTGS